MNLIEFEGTYFDEELNLEVERTFAVNQDRVELIEEQEDGTTLITMASGEAIVAAEPFDQVKKKLGATYFYAATANFTTRT